MCNALLTKINCADYEDKTLDPRHPLRATWMSTNVAMYMTGVTLGIKELAEFALKWIEYSFRKLTSYLKTFEGEGSMYQRSELCHEICRAWNLVLDQRIPFYNHQNMRPLRGELCRISTRLLPWLAENDIIGDHSRPDSWTFFEALQEGEWSSILHEIRRELVSSEYKGCIKPVVVLLPEDFFPLEKNGQEFSGEGHVESNMREALRERLVDNSEMLCRIGPLTQPHGSIKNGFGKSYQHPPPPQAMLDALSKRQSSRFPVRGVNAAHMREAKPTEEIGVIERSGCASSGITEGGTATISVGRESPMRQDADGILFPTEENQSEPVHRGGDGNVQALSRHIDRSTQTDIQALAPGRSGACMPKRGRGNVNELKHGLVELDKKNVEVVASAMHVVCEVGSGVAPAQQPLSQDMGGSSPSEVSFSFVLAFDRTLRVAQSVSS